MKNTIELDEYEVAESVREYLRGRGHVPEGKIVTVKFTATDGKAHAVADISEPKHATSYIDR